MRGEAMRIAAFLFVLLVAASGCVLTAERGGTVSVRTPDFFGLGEELSRQLVHNRKVELAGKKRLIMTTFVDIDDLGRTSRFGRLLAEALATRMFSSGFGVVELRRGRDLLMKKGTGELVLTRNGSLMAQQCEAEGVVVGTYGLAPTTVIINVRLLDAGSGEVLSVAGIELQRTAQVDGLLADPWPDRIGRMSAYER